MATVRMKSEKMIPYIEKNYQHYLDDNDRENIKKYHEAEKPNFAIFGTGFLLMILGVIVNASYIFIPALLFLIVRFFVRAHFIDHYLYLVVNSVNAKIAAEEEARNKALREQKIKAGIENVYSEISSAHSIDAVPEPWKDSDFPKQIILQKLTNLTPKVYNYVSVEIYKRNESISKLAAIKYIDMKPVEKMEIDLTQELFRKDAIRDYQQSILRFVEDLPVICYKPSETLTEISEAGIDLISNRRIYDVSSLINYLHGPSTANRKLATVAEANNMFYSPEDPITICHVVSKLFTMIQNSFS